MYYMQHIKTVAEEEDFYDKDTFYFTVPDYRRGF